MKRKLKLIILLITGFFFASLVILATVNWIGTANLNRPYDSDSLTKDDLSQLREIFQLKHLFGNEVWPDFGDTEIPIVLFNELYEFSLGLKDIPEGWEPVKKNYSFGKSCYKRKKKDSQAFAVKIGNEWAGSLASRKYMSKDFVLKARAELPPVLAQLFPYWFLTFAKGEHAAFFLHEMFHAFQAIQVPNRFSEASKVYKFEKEYPFHNSIFKEAWNREGEILSSAIETKDNNLLFVKAAEFLKIRKSRRVSINLNDKQIRFEQELEWLEGLAKYIEIQFYKLAAISEEKSLNARYNPKLTRWQDEFRRLRKSLGDQQGDFRFYLSGMAQAFILDRLHPGWKKRAFEEGVYLENLLEIACRHNKK